LCNGHHPDYLFYKNDTVNFLDAANKLKGSFGDKNINSLWLSNIDDSIVVN
jgi:hypothetical protein